MARKFGGYQGKGLRVNLSTGRITVEDTYQYLDFIGGTGLGYKVFWDEVPPKTKAYDEANKIVFAVGPLAGTGALCSGRTAVTTIMPVSWPQHLIGSGHMGGNFAEHLKYAGYDFLIIEGKAERPVWLHVRDGKAWLKDASHVWGQGTRRTTRVISEEVGADGTVAAIGPAGENLVPYSVVVNSRAHTAGCGIGAVMGSKMLKAIALQGSQPVHIAGDKADWEKLINYHRTIIGANNQHVVPSFPSPLFEYWDAGSRWVGAPGKRWGASEAPVTLTSDVRSLNRISYRTNNAAYFLGDNVWQYTVRNNGCFSCPIRCYTVMKDEDTAAKFGVSPIQFNTCVGMFGGREWFPKLSRKKSDLARQAGFVGIELMDDLGVWENYGQLFRDFSTMYEDGIWKQKLGADEYKSIPWDMVDACNPEFIKTAVHRIAYKEGEFGQLLGMGTGYMLEKMGIPEEKWKDDHRTVYWKMGHPKHHANEDDGQAGCVINTQYNRDPMCHSNCNFVRSGLPIEVQKRLAEHFWGSADSVDAIGDYKPTNKYKMIRAKWSIERKELHDMLSLCNWMGPWISTPNQQDGYMGDNSLESKYYRILTGHNLDTKELDRCAERAFNLHRAYTARQMQTTDMRKKHDQYPNWLFEDKKDKAPFTKGTIRMDKADIEKSLDLFYEVQGWDVKTGLPNANHYRSLGLNDVADTMTKEKLVPGA